MRMESVVSDSDRLCSQWLDLLTSGAMSDVRIQCREEEIVTCHSLVLHVRCPCVLTRAIKEDDCTQILILDTFSRDTVSAVLEFVYGGVMRDADNKDVKRLMKEWGLETNDTDKQPDDVMNWTGLRDEDQPMEDGFEESEELPDIYEPSQSWSLSPQAPYQVPEYDSVHEEDFECFPIEDLENVPPSLSTSSSMSPRTPVTSSRTPVMSRLRTPDPVTPLPDYKAMLTPQLMAELRRFGLKPVARKKACLLLNDIYEKTHPLDPCRPRPKPPRRNIIHDTEPVAQVVATEPHTPVTSFCSPVLSQLRTPDPVTPLPDYTAMLTPQLRAELRKFGLKVVPRRKACLLLNNIYEKTHPLVPKKRPKPPRRKIIPDAEPVDISTDDGDDDQGSQMTESQHMPEESILYGGDEGEPQVSEASLHDQLGQFVKARRSLNQMILLYKPVGLGHLHRDVREAGIKSSLNQLKDWLDLECITYRSSNRNKNKAVPEKRKNKAKKDIQSENVK